MLDEKVVKSEKDGLPVGFALLWLAIALAWALFK
jgi:hypothetical protein